MLLCSDILIEVIGTPETTETLLNNKTIVGVKKIVLNCTHQSIAGSFRILKVISSLSTKINSLSH